MDTGHWIWTLGISLMGSNCPPHLQIRLKLDQNCKRLSVQTSDSPNITVAMAQFSFALPHKTLSVCVPFVIGDVVIMGVAKH